VASHVDLDALVKGRQFPTAQGRDAVRLPVTAQISDHATGLRNLLGGKSLSKTTRFQNGRVSPEKRLLKSP
jgi:hypothetical protein